MVLVNGKSIKIFNLDTLDTLKIRIASEFNTLPIYLYKITEDVFSSEEIKIVDVLSLIRKHASKSTNFSDFLTKYSEKIDFLNVKEDILLIWIAYNSVIDKSASFNSLFLDQVGAELVKLGYFNSASDFIRFWENERENVRKNLDYKIKMQKMENEKYVKLYSIFEDIKEPLGYTEFKTEKIDLNLSLKLKNVTNLEIFNYIVLNDAIPFATCKNYYKILKNYLPLEEWKTEENNEDITLKVNEKNVVDKGRYKDYTDVKISISKEVISVNMKLITERGYLSKEEFIDRFLGCFYNLNVEYENVGENEVIGNFYFPQERIDTYVFSDLVMNNTMFSELININESSKATKKKGIVLQPWLQIQFSHPACGTLIASITQQITDRNDPLMRKEDPEIFPHGSPFISIRVRCKDKRSFLFFQEVFSKLMVIYNEKYSEIVNIYKQFIEDFGTVFEYEVKKLKKEHQTEGVFVSNYSRTCDVKRQPTIIVEEKIKKYEKKGIELMLFPRDYQEDEPKYPSDGKNRKHYACLNPDYPFPGLQENHKLSNSKEFPFLPCCFKNKQSDKKGNKYDTYYYGQDKVKPDKKQQELITTDKILDVYKYGNLPDNLENFFKLLDYDINYRYIRLGVLRSKTSFLNAVMVGLETNILNITDKEEIKDIIFNHRSKLNREKYIATAKQSCYDMSFQDISAKISNYDEYLDPKLFTQMLEEYFQCNIYLFNSEGLILPRFIQSYYKNNNKIKPSVFIFEHWGSESDNAEYPQCEVIIRWQIKDSKGTQYYFKNEDEINKKIYSLFNILNESYILNRKNENINFPLKDFKIISQYIDTYGKCRSVAIKYDDIVLHIITDPIPPFATKVGNIEQINDKDLVIGFMEQLKIKPTSQVLSSDKKTLLQINSILGNVKISFAIKAPAEPLKNIPFSDKISYITNSISFLKIFNNNKKISRYIIEYMFWVFSNYINKNNLEISEKVFRDFARDYFLIIPNHQYENVPKLFTDDNSIIKNKKIIVQSKEMLKRLMYVLRLYSVREEKMLFDYYNRQSISQYYVDITDFDHHENQVILQGENSISKWKQDNKFSLVLHNKILSETLAPYFIKNNNFGQSVFLAQNTTTLNRAKDIAIKWKKYNYNISTDTKDNNKWSNLSFTLYSYKNENEIKPYTVEGEENNYNIKIIGYKINDSPFYTVLLEI